MRKIILWIGARCDGLRWAARRLVSGVFARLGIPGDELPRRMALLRNRRRRFRHELAVCGIFRNEAPFLDEWLTLHHAVGVDHFFLYNNLSSDNFRAVLEPWMRGGLVTLTDWPGNQVGAYDDCLRRYRPRSRWIAFIDIDEFLFSPSRRDLREVLKAYEGAAAVFVYWCLFGSNGHQTRPEGSVIENYTRCLGLEAMHADLRPLRRATESGFMHITSRSGQGKSIVNPRLISRAGMHRPLAVWSGRVVDESSRDLPADHANVPDFTCGTLRINHYWSKSIEDLTRKVRGKAAWNNANQLTLSYDPSPAQWLERERQLNESTDTTLLELWRAIREEQNGARRANG